jgi:hypothetical protein
MTRFILIGATLAFFGCTSSAGQPFDGSQIVRQTSDVVRWTSPARYAYACRDECSIFDAASGTFLKTLDIPNPAVLVTDPSGNIYTSTGIDSVSVYSPAGAHLEETLQNPREKSVAIAWSPNSVVVANGGKAAPHTGALSVYAKGATMPSYFLNPRSPVDHAAGVAFDSRGNCYLTFDRPSRRGAVDEFAGCAAGAQPNRIQIPLQPRGSNACCYVTSPAFDAHDNLYVIVREHRYGEGDLYKCQGVSHCQDTDSPTFAFSFDKSFRYTYSILDADGSSPSYAVRCRHGKCVYYSPPGSSGNTTIVAPGEGTPY